MAKFETDNYEFMTFDPSILNHKIALTYLATDPDVRKYAINVDEDIKFRNAEKKLTDSSFLVARKDKIVGYLGLFNHDYFLEMHYAVIASQRGFKYSLTETTGASIIREASDKIFEIDQDIEFIKLCIDRNNINSVRAALNAGFEYYGDVHKELEADVYMKFGK